MWQSATVHGALIVYPKPGTPYPFPKPYEEIPIILGQWWKRDVHEIISEYIASDGKLPNSDAFTINGQLGDLYPCSNNETFKIEVETGKNYLLRLINAAVGKTLVFGIADHKLTIVGINGWHTKPMSSMVDYVEIKTQHSIDCILEANQQPDYYYMAAREYSSYINMDYDHNTTTTAIVKYKGKYVPSSTPSLPYLPSTYSGEPTVSHTRTNTVPYFYVLIFFLIISLGIGACVVVSYRNRVAQS
ncbi:laccase-14-like [Lycium barbarum]|uniref:laccase-14-like n=1 Tax=Lycium barbarum TaxID=112863 RepID=UPI00293E4388|nr:laccase-14-like [Lycium barbarum]